MTAFARKRRVWYCVAFLIVISVKLKPICKKYLLIIIVVDLISFACYHFFWKLFDSAARFHLIYQIGDNGCLCVIFSFFFHHICGVVFFCSVFIWYCAYYKTFARTNKRGNQTFNSFCLFVTIVSAREVTTLYWVLIASLAFHHHQCQLRGIF